MPGFPSVDERRQRRFPPVRVVLIDDEKLVRDLLRTRLEGDGFDVVGEISELAATESVVRHRPDVVVVEARMPGLNPNEIITDLAQAVPSASVVVYTALESPFQAPQLRAAGAEVVVDKADGHTHLMGAMMRVAVRRADKGTSSDR